jgi:hypothetical protein
VNRRSFLALPIAAAAAPAEVPRTLGFSLEPSEIARINRAMRDSAIRGALARNEIARLGSVTFRETAPNVFAVEIKSSGGRVHRLGMQVQVLT